MASSTTPLPRFSRERTKKHCLRALTGLPSSLTDIDPSRVALVFYCLGTFDLLGVIDTIPDREDYRKWLWEQYGEGRHGAGFRPGPFMSLQEDGASHANYTDYDTPHLIMTYTALLSLSILRDDFTRLDRTGVLSFLRSCQREDGSFSIVPGSNESDLRTLYCAFAISNMLGDWSGINMPTAIAFIAKCRSYEGGYGQSPYCEAQGGTTYTAIAALALAVTGLPGSEILNAAQRRETIEWLVRNQHSSGGFCGRTGKDADACYCFWCGAALMLLGARELVEPRPLVLFLSRCLHTYGGFGKAPGENADAYHTYLSLAALSLYPPEKTHVDDDDDHKSWIITPLDPLLNASEATAAWARNHIPATRI